MNFYKKHALLTLLCFFPFCLYPMKRILVEPIKEGKIVKSTDLSYRQKQDLKKLGNINLNVALSNDDFTTENDTSESSESVTEEFVDSITNATITRIAFEQCINLTEAAYKIQTKILLPFTKSQLSAFIKTSEQLDQSIEEIVSQCYKRSTKRSRKSLK